MGIGADYYFTPKAYPAPPEPATEQRQKADAVAAPAPIPRTSGYQELRAAGVDTMLVVLRAATHLDFTPLQVQPASRYGEAVATYYTLAWFDRYLRGLGRPELARDGHRRLLASVFDDSADIHAISTGSYEADGNRPQTHRWDVGVRPSLVLLPLAGGHIRSGDEPGSRE